MISSLNIPQWSQRNPQWSGQRLGTEGSTTTIGQSGCLITSISMMNAGFSDNQSKTPNTVDDIFSDNGGYANYNLVVWNAVNRLLPDCSTQGQIFCQNSPAPVTDIVAKLDAGLLAVLQVGFGGTPSNMHFLLAVGYDGGINGETDIIFHDPWYGDRSQFSSGRYGTGFASKDILAIHYFADGSPAPVKPATPVSSRPAVQPLLGYQRVVRDGVNVNYRQEANQSAPSTKLFQAGDVLDFKGFVHGENIGGSDIWFVGRYSNGYAFSGAFIDADTHDLPDLTPTPTPVPPAQAPESTPEAPQPTPDPEWVQTWRPDPEKERTVASQTNVIEMPTQKVIGTLPVGTVIRNIAGHFTYQNTEWVRTKWSVDNNKWNGVKKSDLSEPTIDIPVSKQSPASMTTEQLLTSFTDLSGDVKQAANSNWNALWTHVREITAILISPLLKILGRKH